MTDIKQYHYCKRIIFYNYVMPLPRPITPKMQMGSDRHEVEEALEGKRVLKKYGLNSGLRKFKVYCYSKEVGLSGVVDMVIESIDCEYPVEFKMTFRDPMINAKYQVVAYAMLLAEKIGKLPPVGFILCIPTRRLYQVEVTDVLLDTIREDLNNIRNLIRNEEFPPATNNRQRCVECEFKNYCRDIY